MGNLNKNLFLWVATVLLASLVVFVGVSINQELNTATTANTISFNGEGKVSAKPDIAMVNFAIVTEAANSKAAQDLNSPKSKSVTDLLKKLGVDEKDLKTTSYNIYPQYNYPRSGMPEIKGYQVSQGFEVKVRDLTKVGSILDGLVSAGANNINNLGLSIDNPDKLKTEARAKAVADAKQKAGELESQIGIKLGKIVSFSENINGFPGPMFFAKSAEVGLGGGGPSIPTGENEITVDVTLTYQIK